MLVALDGPQVDDGLLRYAAMLRRVLPGIDMLCLSGQGSAILDGHLKVHLPGVACATADGDPLDSILDAAAQWVADVILVGQSGAQGRRLLARRLAMKAPCSVWLVPERPPDTIRRILAPVDFSLRSADTLSVATALAEASGVDECIALHVHFNDAAVTFDEFDEILAEDQYRAFRMFVAPIDLHGVFAKAMFVDASNVAQAIVKTADEQDCDLIVMGTRGRSTSAAVLLGSETEHCMMISPVPLLAVKHFGASLSLLKALRDERLHRRGDEHFT